MTRTYASSSRGARRRIEDPDDEDEIVAVDDSDNDDGHGRNARTQNTQYTQDEDEEEVEEDDSDESEEARRVRREEKKRRLEEKARRREEKRAEKSREKRRRETMEGESEPYIQDEGERAALMAKWYDELDVLHGSIDQLESYETVRARLDAADDQVTEEETNALLQTVNEFRDVPVTFSAGRKHLIDLGKKYTDLEVQIDKAIESFIDTARGLEQVAEDHEEMNELQADFLALLQQNAERKIWHDVIEELLSELQREGELEDLADVMTKRVRNRLEEYSKLTTRAKFKDDDDFNRFRTAVWEVHHEDEGMPPITRWLPHEAGDPEDEDIEFGGSMMTFRCPLTLTSFQDACKSTVCNHHYSYEAIMHHIQRGVRNRPPKCPVSGCHAILTRACIIRDPAMQERADRFVERQRRREEMEAEEL